MADVVGFSEMMGRDEEGTTTRILRFHERIRATVEQHGGRIVGTAGDSAFGDFDSIVEALDCATSIQRSLHSENASRLDEERIEARIGLHLGDVIVDEYNVFGDGVNIAARLEQLADPGGIVLSEAVYQQVRGRSDLPFEEIGSRTLKNIAEPIRLYRIGPDAFGGRPVESRPERSEHVEEGSEAGKAIRSAIDSIAGRIADEIEASRDEDQVPDADLVIDPGERTNGDPVVSAFNAGTLSIAAIGVLGVLARTSGWTDNAWYPFVGAWFLGIALGRLVAGVSGRSGIALLFRAFGFGVGAAFFGSEVVRAVLWVMAAGMLGSSIQGLRRS